MHPAGMDASDNGPVSLAGTFAGGEREPEIVVREVCSGGKRVVMPPLYTDSPKAGCLNCDR